MTPICRTWKANAVLVVLTLCATVPSLSAGKMRSWQGPGRTASPISARNAMGVATARDRLYLFGGDGGDASTLGDLLVFDPATRSWDDLSKASVGTAGCRETYGMGFAAVGNRLYSFGGYLYSQTVSPFTPSADLFDALCIFDLAEMAWKDPDVSGVRPTARGGMGFGSVGDTIYLFGGFGGSNLYLNDLHLLDTSNNKWQAMDVAVSPSPRAFAGFASDGSVLYLFGGINATGNTTNVLNDLHVFNPSTTSWQELSQNVRGSVPSKRAFMGCAAAGGRLFLFGGREAADGPSVNHLHVLDLSAMVWEDLSASVVGASISARSFMGFAGVGQNLYVIGGLGDDDVEGPTLGNLDDMHVLDPITKTSTDLLSVKGTPHARTGFGLESVGGRLYMFGGRWRANDEDTISNELLRFDPPTNVWQDISASTRGPAPAGRFDMGHASFNDKMYLFGGSVTMRSTGFVNELHVLDVSQLSWRELTHNTTGPAPSARTNMALAAVGDALYVFGGSINAWRPNLYRGDFFKLDLAALQWHDLTGNVTGRLPTARAYMSLGHAEDGRLYLFGGRGTEGEYLNDLHVFDPAAMEWKDVTASTAGEPPAPSRGYSVAAGLGRLFVVGGRGATDYVADVHALHISGSSLRWEDLSQATASAGSLPLTEKAGIGFIDGTLYHFGGWGRSEDGQWAHSDAFSVWKAALTIRATWANTTVLSDLVQCYDWDVLEVSGSLDKNLSLCGAFLPCELSLSGSPGALVFAPAGQVRCSRLEGCARLSLDAAHISCAGQRASAALVVSSGARIDVAHTTVAGCSGPADSEFLDVLDGSVAEVSQSRFQSLRSLGAGGAILARDSTLRVAGSEFRDCVAVRGGGAIAASGRGAVLLRDCVFAACASEREGGCVFALGPETSIEGCAFDGARSGADGGAVSAVGRLRVEKTTFKGCSAAGSGGALHARGLVDAFVSQEAAVTVQASLFRDCSARAGGGAIAIEGGECKLLNTTVRASRTQGRGGAVAAQGGAVVDAEGCLFEGNAAAIHGGALSVEEGALRLSGVALIANEGARGGGGMYAKDAQLRLEGVRAAMNAAEEGGGGALLWHGEEAPGVEGLDCTACAAEAGGEEEEGCAGEAESNRAMYGACVASGYTPPLKVAWPLRVTAGVLFEVAVAKQDHYNQTITSDSSSVVQVKTRLLPAEAGVDADARGQARAQDPSVAVLGPTFLGLERGEAQFAIALSPTFAAWNASSGATQLLRAPVLELEGFDLQASGTSLMLSDPAPLDVEEGDAVCPLGSVLTLTQTALGMRGACERCAPGTYSLHPLSSPHASGPAHPPPACLPCPAGGICAGGASVSFETGTWAAVDGQYLLRGCPAGHEVVNEQVAGSFSHAAQRCRACTEAQYILNPDTDACQPCPRGLVCSGRAHVQPRVSNSTWVVSGSTLRLTSCPAGHRLAPAADEEFKAEEQRCEVCPAGSECVSAQCTECSRCEPGHWKEHAGPEACLPCPANTFRTQSGAAELVACLQCPAAASTRGRSAQSSSRACVCDAGYYPLGGDEDTPKCQPCPIGARCNGTALQPAEGSQWREDGGEMRLVACTAGFILVRNDAFPASDECVKVCFPASDECVKKCPIGTYSLVPAVHPDTLSVRSASVAAEACMVCKRGLSCDGAAAITSTQGYWLANAHPEERRAAARRNLNGTGSGIEGEPVLAEAVLVPCPPKACGNGGVCRPGHTGAVCGYCQEEFVMSGHRCHHCGAAEGVRRQRILVGCVLGGLFLAAYGYFAVRPAIYGDGSSADSAAAKPSWFRTHFITIRDNVKIVVSFFQVVSTYRNAFSTDWPAPLPTLYDISDASRLELRRAPFIACVFHGASFSHSLLFCTVTPVVVCLLLALPLAILRLAQSPKWPQYMDQVWRTVGAFMFLVFPTVSVFSFAAFNCQRITSELHLLVADYREACPNDSPSGFLFVYSLVCVVLFPLGIPLAALWAMLHCEVPRLARMKAEQAQLRAMILLYIKQRADRIMLDPSPLSPDDSGTQRDKSKRKRSIPGGSARRQWHRKSSGVLSLPASEDAGEGGSKDDGYNDVQHEQHEEFQGNELEEELTKRQIIALLLNDWRPGPAPILKTWASESSGSGCARSEAAGPTCAPKPSLPANAGPRISVRGMEALSTLELRGRPWQELLCLLRQAAALLAESGELTVHQPTWDGSMGEAERKATSRLGFLLLTYKPRYWWFELLELSRKAFFSCAIVFVWPRSVRQIQTALAVTVVALLGTMKLQPYRSDGVLNAQIFSLFVQSVTLFYGTMLTAADGTALGADDHQPPTAPTLLVVLFCMIPVFPLLLVALKHLKQAWVRHALARPRQQEPEDVSLGRRWVRSSTASADLGHLELPHAWSEIRPEARCLRDTLAAADRRVSAAPRPAPTSPTVIYPVRAHSEEACLEERESVAVDTLSVAPSSPGQVASVLPYTMVFPLQGLEQGVDLPMPVTCHVTVSPESIVPRIDSGDAMTWQVQHVRGQGKP